ncbi:MAG: hypothetical protein HFG80_11085 [Eubacterium sp.]|nr:hypothetical protein [Eubacterium sp.]
MAVADTSIRDYRWDNIKFLLITLVVVGHFLDPFKEEIHWMKTLWLCIYILHMPAFLLVAGMFAKSVMLRPKELAGKAAAYFRLYLYYEFAIFIIKIICSEEHKARFRIFRENLYPWFLFVLAAFLLITFAVRKLNPPAVFWFAVFVGCMAGYDPTMNNLFCSSRLLTFFPFFLLGFYLDRKPVNDLLDKTISKIVSAVVLAAGFFAVWQCADQLIEFKKLFTGNGSFYSLPYPQLGCLYRLFYYVIVTGIIFMVFSLIPVRKSMVSGIGKRTMQIYVGHGLVVQVLLHTGFFEKISEEFGTGKQILMVLLAIGLTILLAIPVLGKPVQLVLSSRCFLAGRTARDNNGG